eukprot:9231176-Pyramimonas_sp.AAC.1
MPSVDCILQRARLVYLRRVLIHGPVELHALLHVQVRGERVPWTKLIIADLVALHERVIRNSKCFLPVPLESPQIWGKFIREAGSLWSPLVQKLCYCDSVADSSASSQPEIGDGGRTAANPARPHVCD